MVVIPLGTTESEVDDLGFALRGQDDVVRLHVQMDDVLRVHVGHPLGKLDVDVDKPRGVELFGLSEVGQVHARDVFHRQGHLRGPEEDA